MEGGLLTNKQKQTKQKKQTPPPHIYTQNKTNTKQNKQKQTIKQQTKMNVFMTCCREIGKISIFVKMKNQGAKIENLKIHIAP